jgi:hypothetical protein
VSQPPTLYTFTFDAGHLMWESHRHFSTDEAALAFGKAQAARLRLTVPLLVTREDPPIVIGQFLWGVITLSGPVR